MANVRTLQSVSPDRTKVVVDTRKVEYFSDLRAADITAGSRGPVDLVTSPSAYLLDFTDDNANVLYLTDWDGPELQLVAQPALGGSTRTLAQGVVRSDVLNVGTGAGAVVLSNGNNGRNAKYVHAGTGRVSDLLADVSGEDGAVAVRSRKLALIKCGEGEGLYGVTLP